MVTDRGPPMVPSFWLNAARIQHSQNSGSRDHLDRVDELDEQMSAFSVIIWSRGCPPLLTPVVFGEQQRNSKKVSVGGPTKNHPKRCVFFLVWVGILFDPPPKETDDPIVLEHHFDFSQWVWIHHVEKKAQQLNDTELQFGIWKLHWSFLFHERNGDFPVREG